MGQEKEFKRLFREYYPQLYAFAFGIVKDEEACRDIIGDAFEKLWTQLDDIKDANERGFLYLVIRNKCIDRIRNSVSRQRYELFYKCVYGDETDSSDMRLMESEDRIEKMYQLIGTLTPQTRRILEACYFQGKRYADVAEELGISTSTVKKHIVQAFRILVTIQQYCFHCLLSLSD